MKIFLLEDDFALNKIIKSSLEEKGFFTQSCDDGYKAVNEVLNKKFDLYILDVNVLGFDGHKILEIIREENPTIPVIMISADIEIENMKKSYELGCNDHIKKPFSFEELYLKIQYLLDYKDDKNSQKTNIGYDFSFDLVEEKLYQNQNELELSLKEKHLLTLFVKNINQTVTNEMIHEYVWDSKELEAVSMRSVIHKLKKKLKNGMIINIRGIGYKLLKI